MNWISENLPLIVGIVFVGGGMYMMIMDWIRTNEGYHTEGEIIEVKEKWSFGNGKLSNMKYPIVKFKDENDTIHELLMEFGTSPSIYSTGQKIKIIYYKGEVFPTAIGWKIIYGVFVVIGFIILGFQIF
ncbi:MAG: hypothetical protein H7Y04_10025 [Verrucomicrobia bacterium]|nr:hypothetical protein [Cytophagales bacterium]